jgi:hypothetical protein
LSALICTRTRVAGGSSTLGFGLVITCDDTLIMCGSNLFWDTFHTKYLNFETLPIR